MRFLWAVVALLAAGCTTEYVQLAEGPDADQPETDGDVDDGGDAAPAATLTIAPETATLETNAGDAPATLQLQAFRQVPGESPVDVTAEATWFFEESAAATVSATGLVTATNRAGGEVLVHAEHEGMGATATLTVILEAVVVAADDPELPERPDRYFPDDAASVVDDPWCPAIIYPAHETMLPPNMFLVLFQWRADDHTDLFRLSFRGPYSRVDVYTTLESWLALEDDWQMVARSHAGGSVQVEISAVDSLASGDTVYRSEPVTLFFGHADVPGVVYYWSTGSVGILRASLRRPTPELFYPDPDDGDDTCVACHTISRDGRQMVAGYGGEHLLSVSVPEREVLVPTGLWDMGWGTFSPDGNRILTANKGGLRLVDARTGDAIGPNDGAVAIPDGEQATFPDWSPVGDFIAVTLGEKATNKEAEHTIIARLPYDDGAWGAPEVLVEPWGDLDTCFFPTYSPDSEWLLFACAHGKSKDQKRARLYLMRAAGGPPIELLRLNERVGLDDGEVELGNTMPTWAPAVDPDLQWVVFSSLRAYGEVLAYEERDQIWVAALDLAMAETGDDPSYAAFWLPLQQTSENNHRAFWTLDPDEPCDQAFEICDGVDNDCDGITDEECIECAAEEICVNGLDDDCDGAIDDGCGCTDVEICDNGEDDDCDGLVDDDDEDCSPI